MLTYDMQIFNASRIKFAVLMISVLDENKLIILSSSPESGGQTLFISLVKSCLMSMYLVQWNKKCFSFSTVPEVYCLHSRSFLGICKERLSSISIGSIVQI